jgi:hypothetical protein
MYPQIQHKIRLEVGNFPLSTEELKQVPMESSPVMTDDDDIDENA